MTDFHREFHRAKKGDAMFQPLNLLAIHVAEASQEARLRTGIVKSRALHPVTFDDEGVIGDTVVNRRHHGGPDQAVLIYGEADYAWWEERLQQTIARGLFGDNLLVDKSTASVCVGDRFEFGELVLEATAPRIPCGTFAALMRRRGVGGWIERFATSGRPGVYARVLHGATLQAQSQGRVNGLPECLSDGPLPGRWLPRADSITVADLLTLVRNPLATDAELERALDLPIASRLRAALQARLDGVDGGT